MTQTNVRDFSGKKLPKLYTHSDLREEIRIDDEMMPWPILLFLFTPIGMTGLIISYDIFAYQGEASISNPIVGLFFFIGGLIITGVGPVVWCTRLLRRDPLFVAWFKDASLEAQVLLTQADRLYNRLGYFAQVAMHARQASEYWSRSASGSQVRRASVVLVRENAQLMLSSLWESDEDFREAWRTLVEDFEQLHALQQAYINRAQNQLPRRRGWLGLSRVRV